MKTTKFRGFNAVLVVALVLSMVAFVQPAEALGGGSGSMSLTTLGSASTQNFDTLANTGTTNNLTINGWYLNETGTAAANNGQYLQALARVMLAMPIASVLLPARNVHLVACSAVR